ncbi:MAG: alpha/beta hydrolase [Actinomycetota bacterium]|nr:alpha/beta hydrolase [Actinomycetota bacterium]
MSDLVLIHGLGSSSSYWDNVRPALEESFDQVIAVTLPGHGPAARRLSPAEAHPRELGGAVVATLGRRGVERPHVVGISLGGWVALEMAALGHAASVVALAPAGLWASRGRREYEEVVVRPLLRVADPLLPAIARIPAVKQFGLMTNVKHPTRVSEEQFVAAARALEQAKGFTACDVQAVRNRFELGSKVQVPSAVAFGDADRVLPASTSQERTLAPPGAEWVVVPDCGHAMTWDQPDACLEIVARTCRASAA